MATIGLDKLYYAPITESATGEETYIRKSLKVNPIERGYQF